MTSPTTSELKHQGKALRATVPRSSLGSSIDTERDPVTLLDAQNEARLADLIPIRWSRMAVSPFTFFRGAATVMAHDLATTPVTGLRVQACGDAHLSNFGLYASPERTLVFDLSDFDETTSAPWEWDLERLVASLAVAARASAYGEEVERDVARSAAAAYRLTVQKAATTGALAGHHAMVTADSLMRRHREVVRTSDTKKVRKHREQVLRRAVDKARRRTSEQALAKLSATRADGAVRIVEQPPLIQRLTDPPADLMEVPTRYRATVSPDIDALLHRFQPVDYALKVVGVGSVGTRCYILLCLDSTGRPLFLQVKEAVRSVLEPYAGASEFSHMGQRVVHGQRIMQAVSDPFLGWTESEGRHYYVRQFRDMKGSFEVETFSAPVLGDYATLCGGVLARAHLQSCEPALLAGYLGSNDNVDTAMADFAVAYADQNDRDYQTFLAAIDSGRLRAAASE